MTQSKEFRNVATTVVLRGGAIATIKPLTARDLLEYSDKSQRLGSPTANLWLLTKAVDISGVPITADNVNQLLRFRDRVKVDATLFKLEGEPTINDGASTVLESEDFTLPDGRRILVLDPEGSLYDRYLETLPKSYGKALAMAFKGLFTVEGMTIDDAMLDSLPPEGLGFEAAGILLPYLVGFFQPSPAP